MLLKAMAGAVVRGNFSVIPAFFATGKRSASVDSERRALLEALSAEVSPR